MASTQRKDTKTPELIPWMPPGKKASFNILTTKKNSKQELPEFGKSNAADVFGEMSESRKTEDARKDMESRIKTVLEEEEEDELDGRGRKRSNSADRSRRKDRAGSGHKGRSKSEERSRSRNRRYERHSRDGDKSGGDDDEGYHEGGGGKHKGHKHKSSRKNTKLRWNYGTQTTATTRSAANGSSGGTSGVGDSLIEDVEDVEDETRRSIQFIDSVNPQLTQFDREYQDAMDPNKNYYNNQQQPGMVNQGFDPGQQHHWDINPPYGYYQQQQQQFPMQQQYPQQMQMQPQQYPNGGNNFQSLPPNMHMVNGQMGQMGPMDPTQHSPSPYGFQSVNLVGGGPPSNSTNQTQEAWLVFPRNGNTSRPNLANYSSNPGMNNGGSGDSNGHPGSARSFTARPVNLAGKGSVGSLLKQSFTNINRARNGSDQVEQLNLVEEENREQRRGRMHKSACRAGVITVIAMAILLAIFVGIAVIATNNGSAAGSSSENGEFTPRQVNNGTGPCSQYFILSESWRNIPSSGVAPRGTPLYCDQPLSQSSNVKVREGWYRFQEPAGTYLPTTQPWQGNAPVQVCGTNIVPWLNGDHPLVSEGIVDREICFQWDGGPCQYSVQTQVRTCESAGGGIYYVYYLKPPSTGCNYAFCARS